MTPDKTRVLLGLSGGVGSGVAGALLKNQGYDVTAAFVDVLGPRAKAQVQPPPETAPGRKSRSSLDTEAPPPPIPPSRCAEPRARAHVEEVAKKLEIPLHVIDGVGLFEAEVLDGTIHGALTSKAYLACFNCWARVRWRLLKQKAMELGIPWVATAHFAQISKDEGTGMLRLFQAAERSSDESHLLAHSSVEDLGRMLLPLGGLTRAMVQRLAAEFGVQDAREAGGGEGFVPQMEPDCMERQSVALAPYLESKIPKSLRQPGVVKNMSGDPIGEHEGLHLIRIGERPNAELRGPEPEREAVIHVEARANLVTVGKASDLAAGEFLVERLTWIRPIDRLRLMNCKMRVGRTREEHSVELVLFENDMAHARLSTPTPAIRPGERVAIYEGEEVLGGGVIQRKGVPR